MKKRTSVYIDPELIKKAKEKKLNLSKLLEKAIKDALNDGNLGFRVPSRRGSWVQIPPPAFNSPEIR